MRFTVLHRPVQVLRLVRTRLGLTVSGVVALGTGLVVLGLSTVAFGGVTEDVTRHNGLSTSDMLHLGWFTRHRSDLAIWVAHLLSDIGNVAALALVAVVATFVLWRRGVRLVVAVAPGVALGIGGVAAAAGKSLVRRSRPPVALHLVSESSASFPSGHATDSTALFVTLALVVAVFVFRRPLARCACVIGSALLSGAIGVSRLVLGVHWPTDVLAGYALGLSIALLVTIAASIATRLAAQGPASPNRQALARVTALIARQRRTRSLEAA